MLPPLLKLKNESEYKNYYIENYCNKEIKTHDGIVVKFFEDRFEHSFYKRTKKTWKSKKDIFSQERGERMDWIKYVLNDPTITPKKGYDKATQSYDSTRRVAFLNSENYLVVIYINQNGEGKFITAYLVDNENAADKIRNSPNWE
ncbi:hypothetical protein [uncultured Clostridium sp.]|uniref:hypothetical protein n=1 Tax=uncultured Clostridium sp. TaxID=59620 RepID=UPI0026020A20|nr:hypothetical protein [uncultured Clostridium sp.]